MHTRDLSKMWMLSGLLAGCGGGAGDPTGAATEGTSAATETGASTEGPVSASSGPGTTPTTTDDPNTTTPTTTVSGTTTGEEETTVGVTTDPTDGTIGALTVCAGPMPLFVASWSDNMTLAVDPAGTALYLSIYDKAYRWSIGGGADCGFTHDRGYQPTLSGEAVDMAVTADGQVYAGVEFDSYSPKQIWPQADAEPCLLGPDDPLSAQSIAVGGDGTALFAGSGDADYKTQLYRAATDVPMCTLQLQWTETDPHDVGYESFVIDAEGRTHVLGRDYDDPDMNHAILVYDPSGALIDLYKPASALLCTDSQLARCGADVCVLSCSDLYRFSTAGDPLSSVDLAELLGSFDPNYTAIAGTDDGTIYVLQVAGSSEPDGYPLTVLRFGP